MPTLDSLQSEIDALERRMYIAETKISSHDTSIQNHGVTLSQHSDKLKNHESRLQDHDNQLTKHDQRLHTLEDSSLKITLTRVCKAPVVNTKGLIDIFMPDKLKLEDFEKFNQDVDIAQDFNWFRKISNSVGRGKVCFDFDREKGIKAILLGQATRVLIPTGLKISNITPIKSTLKVVNSDDMVINKGLVYGIEIIPETEEAIVSIHNYTGSTVHIYSGEILCSIAHMFQYKTVPEVIIPNIGG